MPLCHEVGTPKGLKATPPAFAAATAATATAATATGCCSLPSRLPSSSSSTSYWCCCCCWLWCWRCYVAPPHVTRASAVIFQVLHESEGCKRRVWLAAKHLKRSWGCAGQLVRPQQRNCKAGGAAWVWGNAAVAAAAAVYAAVYAAVVW